jgi:hypothetical protein
MSKAYNEDIIIGSKPLELCFNVIGIENCCIKQGVFRHLYHNKWFITSHSFPHNVLLQLHCVLTDFLDMLFVSRLEVRRWTCSYIFKQIFGFYENLLSFLEVL